MRYQLKQKVFSIGDDYTIADASGNAAFVIDGKAWSLRQRTLLQDTAGNELAVIERRLMSWGPTFEIHRHGELAAVVKQHLFTLLHCAFTVDVPGPDDLTATGDLIDHEYRVERGGRTVATISKQWFAWSDSYGVDIADGEDPVLILASTVVIDMACHPDDKR
jgi:uncharacterized protein YxjI